jgi:hypothetical protein
MASENNEMTGLGMDSSTSTSSAPEHKLDPEQNHRMIDSGGDAQLFCTENGIVMMNRSNGINVDDYGTYIDGKINFGRPPSDFRIGGFWVFNDKLLTSLPSTTYTPIQTLIYSEPQGMKYIQRIVAVMSSLG